MWTTNVAVHLGESREGGKPGSLASSEPEEGRKEVEQRSEGRIKGCSAAAALHFGRPAVPRVRDRCHETTEDR